MERAKMKRISNNYLTTLDINSASDMIQLNEIKDTIRISNRSIFNNRKLCVVLRGRKPIVKTGRYSYDWGGNIVGGIANASKLDVYIYTR